MFLAIAMLKNSIKLVFDVDKTFGKLYANDANVRQELMFNKHLTLLLLWPFSINNLNMTVMILPSRASQKNNAFQKLYKMFFMRA